MSGVFCFVVIVFSLSAVIALPVYHFLWNWIDRYVEAELKRTREW